MTYVASLHATKRFSRTNNWEWLAYEEEVGQIDEKLTSKGTFGYSFSSLEEFDFKSKNKTCQFIFAFIYSCRCVANHHWWGEWNNLQPWFEKVWLHGAALKRHERQTRKHFTYRLGQQMCQLLKRRLVDRFYGIWNDSRFIWLFLPFSLSNVKLLFTHRAEAFPWKYTYHLQISV